MAGPVFISYSHIDARYVDRLTHHLAAAGLQVWSDRGIPGGASWVRMIDEQVRACSVLVPVMSPHSQASDWVTNEILLAQDLGKPIMPVLLAGRPFTALLHLQYEDVRHGHLPSARFIEELARLSGARLPAEAPGHITPPAPVAESHAELRQVVPDAAEPPASPRRGSPRRLVLVGITAAFGAVCLAIGLVYGLTQAVEKFAPESGPTTSATDDGAPVLRHGGSVLAVVWSSDGGRLATAGPSGTTIWDATTAAVVRTLDAGTDRVAWSPSGDRLALAGSPAQVWDAATGQRIHRLGERTDDYARDVIWAPGGTRLATVGTHVKIWDAATGQAVQTLAEDTELVTAAAWSPDGTLLATGGYDNLVRIWDVSSGQARTLPHSGRINAVAWSPDGGRLATASGDDVVQVWDAAGQVVHTLTGHSGPITALAWSADGRLATASDDTVRIWDTAGQRIHTLTGHSGPINALAWSPDGRLATASDDDTARIWDTAAGQTVETLTGHTGDVVAVAWSPDGTELATASDDSTARIWLRGG